MDETQTGAFDTGGSDWASWFQGVAGGVINKAADATYVRPYDIQSLKIQALGQNGGYYTEGQPGTRAPSQGLGISPTVLLLGGAAIVALLMLKD